MLQERDFFLKESCKDFFFKNFQSNFLINIFYLLTKTQFVCFDNDLINKKFSLSHRFPLF